MLDAILFNTYTLYDVLSPVLLKEEVMEWIIITFRSASGLDGKLN
jgi:hypothetical protein